MCEVLGCGFLHLRNLHEELILGSNIVVGSRCSCVAGGVRIKLCILIQFKNGQISFPMPQEEEDMRRIPYASAVGRLMYAMSCTRPDICYAVGIVSHYQSNVGLAH